MLDDLSRGYGAAAIAPVPPIDAGLNPIVGDPFGNTWVGGRSYYAEPPTPDGRQLGTFWAQTGAFHPAWANPWGYDFGYATVNTIWPLAGTTLPAAGFNTEAMRAQQGNSPGAVTAYDNSPLGG